MVKTCVSCVMYEGDKARGYIHIHRFAYTNGSLPIDREKPLKPNKDIKSNMALLHNITLLPKRVRATKLTIKKACTLFKSYILSSFYLR